MYVHRAGRPPVVCQPQQIQEFKRNEYVHSFTYVKVDLPGEILDDFVPGARARHLQHIEVPILQFARRFNLAAGSYGILTSGVACVSAVRHEKYPTS